MPPGFVVVATGEALLREALARPGPPPLAAFVPWPELEPTTYQLVLRAITAPVLGNAIAAVAATHPIVAPAGRFGCELRLRHDPADVAADPESAELRAMSKASFGCVIFYGLLVFV